MDYNPFRSRATQETVQEKKMMCEKCGKMHENGEECKMDDDEKNEAMDPVNKKELKGKHADRKDKDLDNDGDADSSDKYLHKRRKAISKAMEDTNKEGYYKDLEIKKQDKAMGAKPVPAKKKKVASGGGKEGDVIMNPKMDTEKKTEQKESRIRSALKSVLSEKKENHSPNKDKAEKMSDMIKGKGAEDMMADANKKVADGPEAHLNEPEIDVKNFQNMTKNVPSKKMRSNDNPKGDTKIVPGGTQFKDPAAMKPESKDDVTPFKTESYDKMSGLKAAYASMYEKKTVEDHEEISELSKDLLHKAADKAASQAGTAGRKGDEVKASQKTDQSRKFAKGATKAGDRDAEKAYQASKGN